MEDDANSYGNFFLCSEHNTNPHPAVFHSEIWKTYVSWSNILVPGAGDPGSADCAGFTGHDFRQGHFPKWSRTLRQLRSGRDGWKCRVRQSIRWLP